MISGDNFQFGHNKIPYSYYFSNYNHIWGWASWRRAWQYYDVNMNLWPEVRDKGELSNILAKREVPYWTTIFEKIYQDRIDTWDYQWTFACWIQNGLSILPCKNLVQNIGFGEEAAHTKNPGALNMPGAEMMPFPLKHPPVVILNKKADNFTFQNHLKISFINLLKRKLFYLYERFTKKNS